MGVCDESLMELASLSYSAKRKARLFPGFASSERLLCVPIRRPALASEARHDTLALIGG
jgi:hypothetical protein